MADHSPEKKSGCVSMLYSGLFRRNGFWPRRTASANSIPTTNNNAALKVPSPSSKRRRGGSDETSFLGPSILVEPAPKLAEKPISKATLNHPTPSPYHYQDQGRKPPNVMTKVAPAQGLGQGRRAPKEAIGISGELDIMIADYQKSKGSSTLVRASSGNVMLYGNLGNLRQSGAMNLNPSNPANTTTNVLDYLPKTAHEMGSTPNGKYSNGNVNGNGVMGNFVMKTNGERNQPEEQSGSLCRALSTRMDPEQLKLLGNEDYKEGRFADALAFYDQAIAIEPNKASYRSNKSAALTGLGRLLEAVFECREAIKIEPSYHRAHHRLATLYRRLGEAENALYHYKQSGPEADPKDVAQAKSLQTHLNKCTEARRLRDWNTLLRETESTISNGADSAPQIFALQAEALLKLHRHQEADTTLSKGPTFDIDNCTKFFGPVGNSHILLIRAQVEMTAGRFEDAVVTAQHAAQLDSSNKEATSIVRKTRGVASARSKGNELFKASKFLESCIAYSEGLEHDPLNSVLLCNRAACRSKLSQFDKAIEDCNKALNVRPSYSKARLRRADCNAKLERWEASIQDYEVLRKEMPEDEEIGRALEEAKAQLKNQRRNGSKDMKVGADVVTISGNDHFRDLVTSPGVSVVLFCNKSRDSQASQLMDQLCKRYPALNFLKLEVEEHPDLAKLERVSSVPAFKIYKNGSRVKDIPGTSHELLESSVKFYST